MTTSSLRSFRRLLALCTALLMLGSTALRAVPLDYNGVALSSAEQSIASSMAGSSGQHRAFVRIDPTLTAVARARAQDMAKRDYFDHVNPDGHGPNYLVRATGYPLPDWWGTDPAANYIESIAAGFTAPGDCWNAWMKSDPHRTHLLAEDDFYADQTSVGVAVYTDSSSTYGTYWVVISAPPRPSAPLKITAPAANNKVTTPDITAVGTTSDESGAAKVEYALENSAGVSSFQTASGVAKWQANLTLQAGQNTIHARSRDASGAIITTVDRSVYYAQMSTLTVSTSLGGSVTGSFAGSTPREIGKSLTIQAQPAVGYIFAGWTGSVTSDAQTLTFTMADGFSLQANFVPNPFANTAAGYQSLVSTAQGAGLLKITSNTHGLFRGKLLLNGERLNFHGRLNADGTAAITMPNGMTLELDMDFTQEGAPFSARLSDSSSSVTLSLDRDAYNAKSNPAPNAGKYLLVFAPDQNNTSATSTSTEVSGQAQIKVSKGGTATIFGHLSDGTAFSTTSFITADGQVAVYAKLNGNTGSLIGELQFSAETASVDGTLIWSQTQTVKHTSFKKTLIADGSAR